MNQPYPAPIGGQPHGGPPPPGQEAGTGYAGGAPGAHPGGPPLPDGSPGHGGAPVPPRRRRRGLRVLGIVTAVFVGLVVVGASISNRPTRAPSTGLANPSASATATAGAIVEKGQLSAVDLQEGDCYNTQKAPPPPGESQPISTVEAVPCATPHTNQVIAKILYGPTVSYADIGDGGARAGDCLSKFKAKLSRAVLTNPDTYQLGSILPADTQSWERNRAVACTVATTNPTSKTLLS
jgi:hypothetical protein